MAHALTLQELEWRLWAAANARRDVVKLELFGFSVVGERLGRANPYRSEQLRPGIR